VPIHHVQRSDLHPDTHGTYNTDEVLERVAHWVKILGLDHWLIHVWLLPGFNVEGLTQRYLGEMEAIVRLREDARVGDMERTIVHELLHLVTAPWKDAYVQVLKTSLSEEQYSLAFGVINEQEENVIERLAEYLIRSGGGEWWGGRPYTYFEPTDPANLKKLSKPTVKPEKATKNTEKRDLRPFFD
jgi:hypothetical protein